MILPNFELKLPKLFRKWNVLSDKVFTSEWLFFLLRNAFVVLFQGK